MDLFRTLADKVFQVNHDRHVLVTVPDDAHAELIRLGRARHNAKNPGVADYTRVHDSPTLEDEIGIVGEGAFEQLTGLPMNRAISGGGDGGRDFTFRHPREPRQVSAAVSTARMPFRLFMRAEETANRPRADLWILSGISKDTKSVLFLGYETKANMLAIPTVPCAHPALAAEGRRNHELHFKKLRPMPELLRYIAQGQAVAA